MTGLILSSASAARQAMLRAADVPFRVEPHLVDEVQLRQAMAPAPPERVAAFLAEQKALAVSRRFPGEWVLGADQTLLLDGQVIGKSRDRAEAAGLLAVLSGREHCLVSAAVLARDGKSDWSGEGVARLTMRPLSAGFISDYLDREGDGILDCVGCYRIEGRGIRLFASVQGDHFSILGLPLLAVLGALADRGLIA